MGVIDQLRSEVRVRHYSIRTEQTYTEWVVRFVRYHNLRHPKEMGVAASRNWSACASRTLTSTTTA